MLDHENKNKVFTWFWVFVIMAATTSTAYYFGFKAPGKDEVNGKVAVVFGAKKEPGTAVVNRYLRFIGQGTDKMKLDHSYTSQALLRLANATASRAVTAGIDLQANIPEVKLLAQKITEDPFVTTHADDIRTSALILSEAFSEIQKKKYPHLSSDVAELKTGAKAIDVDLLTLDQKKTVNGFFRKASEILRKMDVVQLTNTKS